jgi:hypothetical protein
MSTQVFFAHLLGLFGLYTAPLFSFLKKEILSFFFAHLLGLFGLYTAPLFFSGTACPASRYPVSAAH